MTISIPEDSKSSSNNGVGVADGLNTLDQTAFLPSLKRAFPSAVSYEILDSIVQANANGFKVRVTMSVGGDDDTCNNNEESAESAQDSGVVTKDVFLKQVLASDYVGAKKDWSDLRRTLLYARTETRFYKEVLPRLHHGKGLHELTPKVYFADYNFDGWIPDEERATVLACPKLDKDSLPHPHEKGGTIVLECMDTSSETGKYYQDSPLTLEECKQCLRAVALLHAAAWQDVELLEFVDERLSKASFHLQMRNPKEIAGVEMAWKDFQVAFSSQMEDLNMVGKPYDTMGTRVARIAEYVSAQVSPRPDEPYATLVHGDYKSMNVFLARRQGGHADTENSKECDDDQHGGAVMVDFASVGVGLGMSDLAMHIRHAVVPELLENGGEEALVKYYWEYLCSQLMSDSDEGEHSMFVYKWEDAWRHYKLAVVDYFRFFLARMWKGATPETMEKKAKNKNVSLINRSVPSAMAFLKNANSFLTQVEEECSSQQ